MLSSLEALEEGFEATVKKSKEECGDKLEEIRQLIFILQDFNTSVLKCSIRGEIVLPKYDNSLVFTCFLELLRISGHILFLSCNGLYRNAFDNIRYALESIVQALYIDMRHPETPLRWKIEILKRLKAR